MLPELNFSNSRSVSQTSVTERLVKKYARLAKAEAHCIELLHDNENSLQRCELFGAADTTEFLVAKKTHYVGEPMKSYMTVDALPPEQFIGYLEQFSFNEDLSTRARGMQRYVSPELYGAVNSDGSFIDRTLYCFPNCAFQVVPKFNQHVGEWQYCRDNQTYSCPSMSSLPFTDFPKTTEGIIMPILGLVALRLSALYGHQISVEEASERIYDNEFIPEPCWDLKEEASEDYGRKKLVTLNNLPEAFTRTVPVGSHLQRYNMADDGAFDGHHAFGFDNILCPPGRDGYATISNQEGSLFIPLAFYNYAGHPHPVTFPISPTTHFPLYCKDLIPHAETVYLCEYPRFAEDNNTSSIPVISFLNGEWGLQFTDFDPLEGKEVRYLEMSATNDNGLERAHRTMLKAFAMSHKAGNRNFTAYCIENGQEIPYKKLLIEAIEHGYLKDAISLDVDSAYKACLPWDKPTGKKETIFGRAIQTGRINLFSADRGTGKTELMLMLATVGAHGVSLDQSFFKYNLSKPCKTLYIQSEMDEKDDLRKDRLADLENYICRKGLSSLSQGNTTNNLIFHKKKISLIEVKEQCDVLKEIARIDPEHQWHWCIVIDSIKTEMREALNSPAIYSNRIFPWLDFMRKHCIDVSIIDHKTKKDGSSCGTGTIEDLADECFNIEIDNKPNQEGSRHPNSHLDAIKITPLKHRFLKGNRGNTAHVLWETDTQNILRIESWYDDEPEPTLQAPPTTVAEATVTPNQEESSAHVPPMQHASIDQPRLPKTWAELKALPETEQRSVLFEMLNIYKTSGAVAKALNIGESSVKQLMSKLGVNKQSLNEYLRNKE